MKHTAHSRHMRAALVAAAAVAACGQAASAATYTWTNGAADGNWATTTNWNPTAPANGPGSASRGNTDLAAFATSDTASINVVGQSIGGLAFGDGVTFTLNRPYNSTFYLDGGITVGTNATVSLTDVSASPNNYFYMNYPSTWDVGAGSTFTHNASGNNQINSTFHKTGAGLFKVQATGATSYAWGVGSGLSVDGGTFEFNSTTSSKLGPLVALHSSAGAEFKVTTAGLGQYYNDLRLTNNTDNVFAGNATGAYGWFRKQGKASFRIAQAGNFTTPTSIWLKEGTIDLDYSGGNSAVNKIGDTTAVVMNNAVLKVGGASGAAAVDEQMGVLSFDNGSDYSGLAQVLITPGSQNTTLRFTNNDRFYGNGKNKNGAILRFGGVDGTANRVLFGTTGVAPTAGILGGFAVVGTPSAIDYAAYNATDGVTQLAEAGRPTSIANGATNVLLGSGLTNFSGTATINSLKVNGTQALDLGGGTLTLNSGGIIATGAAGASTTLQNGTIAVGQIQAGYSTGHLFLYADRDVTLDAAVTGLEASNRGGVSKAGGGTLTVAAGASLTNTAGNPSWYLRWYEGSLDYQNNADVILYASGQGYAPGAATLVNGGNGTLTKGGAGTMTVHSPLANTGAINVNSGVLAIKNTSGTGSIDANYYQTGIVGGQAVTIAGGAKLQFMDNTTVPGGSFAGTGTIVANLAIAGGTTNRRTLTSNGTTWSPGTSAGTLTLDGNLAAGKNGSTPAQLVVDVTGSGALAGTDNDLLSILGTFTGLTNNAGTSGMALVVNVAPGLDLTGDVLTILQTSSNLSTGSLVFANVTWNGLDPASSSTPAVNMNNGSITLTGLSSAPVPEPAGLAFLALGAAGLLARRRRA